MSLEGAQQVVLGFHSQRPVLVQGRRRGFPVMAAVGRARVR